MPFAVTALPCRPMFLECTTDWTSHVPDMLGTAACFAFHLGAPVPGSAGTWISLPIDAQVTASHGRPATGYFVAAFQPTDLPSPAILTGPCQSSTDHCRQEVGRTDSVHNLRAARHNRTLLRLRPNY